jgi:hypothetical protein
MYEKHSILGFTNWFKEDIFDLRGAKIGTKHGVSHSTITTKKKRSFDMKD